MFAVGTTPLTEIELFTTSFALFLTVIIYGYTMNEVGNIMGDWAKKNREFELNLYLLNKYLQQKNVSKKL